MAAGILLFGILLFYMELDLEPAAKVYESPILTHIQHKQKSPLLVKNVLNLKKIFKILVNIIKVMFSLRISTGITR
ncbi:hypothetical protein [Spirulina subsalsa]|uniref:hypothetical protein n=1 Tax=Spirulina subsalsa TaxID=54311 RepID=UPI00037AEC5C|nr:hypothetical protein [Spirulina subsalsa]